MVAIPAQPQLTAQPTPKVLGATGGSALGAAVATLINWALDNYHLPSSQTLPPNVLTSITVITTALFTFLSGYYTRPAPTQTVIQQRQDLHCHVST
jgi:hypothetical protein